MMRHRRHGATIRPRRVQEETERPLDTEPAHLRAEAQEVIILYPEHRIGVLKRTNARAMNALISR